MNYFIINNNLNLLIFGIIFRTLDINHIFWKLNISPRIDGETYVETSLKIDLSKIFKNLWSKHILKLY